MIENIFLCRKCDKAFTHKNKTKKCPDCKGTTEHIGTIEFATPSGGR